MMDLKKKSGLLLPIVAIMGLASCGGGTSENGSKNSTGESVGESVSVSVSTSTSTSTSPISNSNSENISVTPGPVTITDWTQDEKNLMLELLEVVLPVAPFLEDEYEMFEYDDQVLAYGDGVQVADEYCITLALEGYVFDGDDGFGGYVYYLELTETRLVVVNVYDDIDDGLEYTGIEAWIYEDVEVLPLTEWSEDQSAAMIEALGEELPLAPITTAAMFELDEDEDGPYIYMHDDGDFLADYGATLVAAGFGLDGDGTGTNPTNGAYSYAVYVKESGDNFLVVEITFWEEHDITSIIAYIVAGEGPIVDPVPLTEWSATQKAAMMAILGEELPLAPVTTAAIFEDTDDEIYVEDEGNFVTEYGATLVEAGYALEEEDAGESEDYGPYVGAIYVKGIGEGEDKLYVEVTYWETDEVTSILAYVVGEEVELIPSKTVSITNAAFNTTSYAANNVEHTVNGCAFNTTDVMKSTATGNPIQMKKGTGVMQNNAAWSQIVSITITFASTNTGAVTVLAGTSASALTEVVAVGGVYNLQGATFFKIQATSAATVYITSIAIAVV